MHGSTDSNHWAQWTPHQACHGNVINQHVTSYWSCNWHRWCQGTLISSLRLTKKDSLLHPFQLGVHKCAMMTPESKEKHTCGYRYLINVHISWARAWAPLGFWLGWHRIVSSMRKGRPLHFLGEIVSGFRWGDSARHRSSRNSAPELYQVLKPSSANPPSVTSVLISVNK